MAYPHRVLPFSSAKSVAPAAAPLPGYSGAALHGPSAAMARLWSQIRRVAPHFRTALLTGETGTGGEAVARALHEASPFRQRVLRVLPASAAEVRFAGRSEVGESSVVYLPEIERLSAAAQNGLLRMVRLRGPRAGCVIAFARHELRALVSAGSFSTELAAALGALRIVLPSLSERIEDLPMLLGQAVSRLAKELGVAEPELADDFLEAASEFAWPRNLDQMDEIVTWLLTEHEAERLHAVDFEAACAVHGAKRLSTVMPVRLERLDQLVQEHIRAVLMACGGNKLRAAEVLGISRSTLYRMLDSAVPASALQRTG